MKLLPIIFFLIAIGLAGLIYFSSQLYLPSRTEIPKNFVIQKGQGVKEIVQNLKKQGLIRNRFIFETYVFLKGIEGRFQAGEYELKPKINMIELAGILISGTGVQNETEIKIIEGWTVKEIAEYLERKEIVDKKDFLETIENIRELESWKTKYEFLGELANLHFPTTNVQFLEGYLFPDTYRIFKDATSEEIIRKMLDNFDQKLDLEMRREIKKQGKTIFEVITMASIIEKEVPFEKDRAIVSGIFWKRLEAGMPLQADSTLNYFTGHKSRALSAEELKIDSFYNTYLYPGLPPTPICNPGLSAIQAAVWPKDSPYWFFLSKEDGQTIFSRTLEEHNRNKARWLK